MPSWVSSAGRLFPYKSIQRASPSSRRPFSTASTSRSRAGRGTCVLGPSGVGKTTLLRLILGLEPTGERARVACSDGAPLAGRAAYMAQQDLLLPWLSVLENLRLGAA